MAGFKVNSSRVFPFVPPPPPNLISLIYKHLKNKCQVKWNSTVFELFVPLWCRLCTRREGGRGEKREPGHVMLLVWQKPFGSEQRNQLFTILGEWGWLVATSIFSKGTLLSSSSTHWNQSCFLAFGWKRAVSVSRPSADRKKCFPGDLLILTFCCHCS